MTQFCTAPLHPGRHLQVLCPYSSTQGRLLCPGLWVHFGAATKNTILGVLIIILKTDTKTELVFLSCTCIHHHPGR